MSDPAVDGPNSEGIDDDSVEGSSSTSSSTDATSSSYEITQEAFNDLDASTELGDDDLDSGEATGDGVEPVLDVMAVVEAERYGFLNIKQTLLAYVEQNQHG